ncbi:MAG TPA: ABC transporter permease [Acidimicrobiales bacterium]|jgi:ABC-2 type transport system permease protein|nr:ABC transporter permease [Acidimicrobiales bacterium]
MMGVLRGRLGGREFLGDTGLVAGREIRERLRGRVFRVVTLILFAVVAAAVVIPTLHKGTTKIQRVGVVSGSPALDAELQGVAKSVPVSVEVVNKSDLSQARAALTAGQLDVVVDGAGAILVKNPVSDSDTSAEARFVRAVAVTLGAENAFARAGLTPEQGATVAGARPLPVESLHPGKKARTTAEATALLGVILVFIVLTQYLTWTLMGVMEEKASRVVEVLLATVRPIQLLAGKVIGIGAVALVQAVTLVAFALVLAGAVGSSLVHGAAPVVVAATLAWLVLGYAFYSWMYAAAGSLAERQDQVQSLALPLSAPLIFGYIVSLTAVSSGNPSLLVKVLAYVPPTAPFAMPTLIGFGEATWWQFLLSVVVTLLCTFGVALAAARIYRTAVLQTGKRVRLRDLVPTLAK